MKTITIELTDVQYKALACEALSVEEYLQNYADARTQKAFDNVVRKEIERRINEGIAIPANKEEILMSSDVKTLADIEDESDPEADDYEVN